MTAPVVLIQTNVANTASLVAAFTRLDRKVTFAQSPEEVAASEFVVLPGVGAFDAGLETLDHGGFRAPLLERLGARRPTLCVCLGFQLLFESSEEGAGAGLGVLKGRAERFPNDVRVPQFGWNRIQVGPARYLAPGYVYFANSYRIQDAPAGWTHAVAEHAGPFVAGIEHGGVLGCQFHPELSGRLGQAILRRWLEQAPAAATGEAA